MPGRTSHPLDGLIGKAIGRKLKFLAVTPRTAALSSP